MGEPQYIEGILEGGVAAATATTRRRPTAATPRADPMYDQAVAVVLKTRRPSISLVQRQLRIGYNRAARLIEQMERAGSCRRCRRTAIARCWSPPGRRRDAG